ncbi:hypothetical protein GGI21_002795 [Coemansia aciculifera]|nr:hypothetical protein GGI21_002795 [Coemansia aciculifera]
MSFYDTILGNLSSYIAVTDAEEEVCDLYSVYYSSSSTQPRSDLVDPSKPELEIEIPGSGRRSITLTITQNPHINNELGQTGGVLWNSSIVLSTYFARHHSNNPGWEANLKEANIVELGSGCGLVGLTLHRLGARRVVLTDQWRMMKVLGKNVDRAKTGKNGGVLVAAEYDWSSAGEKGLLRGSVVAAEPVDMVVVCDCVYHEEVVPLVVRALAEVCACQGTGRRAVGIVAQELRSDLVHQAFVEALLQRFTVYRMPVDPATDAFYVLYVVWLKD